MVQNWLWWRLPLPLRIYVGFMPVAAVAVIAVAAAYTDWRLSDVAKFLVLVTCGMISVASTPKIMYTVGGGVTRDFSSIWVLPTAILLPPVYAALVAIPIVATLHIFVHRGVPHRMVFTAAGLSLSSVAASLAFRAFPLSFAGTAVGSGFHAFTWCLAVAGCEILGGRVQHFMIVGAVKLTNPKIRMFMAEFNRNNLQALFVEIDLGVLITLSVALSPALRVKNSTIDGSHRPVPSESMNDATASRRRGPSAYASLPVAARHSRPAQVTTTAGATGFVSESVNYLDVGLKLDVEPQVYLEDEVGIKVGLEVSNIVREIKGASSNTLTYQVGTRNAATNLRLKDGETQVLAGLISDDDRRSADRVPGLGDLPVAGRLFSHTLDNKTRTEIVLLITPRLVRQLARPEAGAVEFAAGTEAATGAPRLGGEIAPLPLPVQPQAPQPPIPTPPGAPDASGLPSIPQPSTPQLVPFGGVKPSAQ